jgi:integrase/recombinase XerD
VGELAGLNRLVEVVSTPGGRVEKKAVPLYELLSMYTARHTFAVQSLLRGMPVVVLQKVLGHAHIQTTMRYAQIVEEVQHDAMRAAWGGSVAPGQGATVNAAALSGTICAVEPLALAS